MRPPRAGLALGIGLVAQQGQGDGHGKLSGADGLVNISKSSGGTISNLKQLQTAFTSGKDFVEDLTLNVMKGAGGALNGQ